MMSVTCGRSEATVPGTEGGKGQVAHPQAAAASGIDSVHD